MKWLIFSEIAEGARGMHQFSFCGIPVSQQTLVAFFVLVYLGYLICLFLGSLWYLQTYFEVTVDQEFEDKLSASNLTDSEKVSKRSARKKSLEHEELNKDLIRAISFTFLWGFLPPVGIYMWFGEHRHTKSKAYKAATEVLKQVQTARAELDTYIKLVYGMRDSYSRNGTDDPTENIPQMRLQIDRIKFSPKFADECEKIHERAHKFAFWSGVKKRRHFDAYHSALMFQRLVALLKATKIFGFMRSAGLLQQYIKKRYESGIKTSAVQAFAEDFLDEGAYAINKALTDEVKVFVDASETLDFLENDLNYVIKKNHCFLSAADD